MNEKLLHFNDLTVLITNGCITYRNEIQSYQVNLLDVPVPKFLLNSNK